MALVIALILATACAVCAFNYILARRDGTQKYIRLQKAKKRAIEKARAVWDKADNKQTAWRLSTFLCAIGVVLAVFIPGLNSVYQLIPIGLTITALAALLITAFKSQLEEQTFGD